MTGSILGIWWVVTNSWYDMVKSVDLMDNKWVPRYVESEPKPEALFNMISGWLADCVNNHTRCRQNATALPHMVLDLESKDPVVVFGHSREERYAALTHCWGQKPPLQTKTTNLFSRMAAIPFSELPKTFQDAVVVTRRLGLRYLWIDSLCIIQDDLEDWKVESAKMMAYYRDAYITISALSSSDSHQGMLGHRTPAKQLLLSARSQLHIRRKTPQFWSMFDGEPLNARAWTFQERLLSTRIIHIGKKELLWECNTCSAREAGLTNLRTGSIGDDNIPPKIGNFGVDPKLSDPSLAALQLVKVPDIDTIMTLDFKRLIIEAAAKNIDTLKVWKHLVTEFMKRKITRNSDRLPAIGGLAKTLFEGAKFTYLAGILKERPYGLLWDVGDKHGLFRDWEHHDLVNTVSTQLDAPSWSWAAARNPIFFQKSMGHSFRVENDAEIMDSDIKCIGPDMFGQVSSGWIRLSAHICVSDVKADGRNRTPKPYYWRSWNSPSDVKPQERLFIGIRSWEDTYGNIKITCIQVVPDPKEANAYKRVGHLVEFVAQYGNFGKKSSIILI
ncbi:hypothetical protein EG329_003919 [Mollisiaceae sp. DMI_Dod_QoI]|nr:hypothetical protein EG329_003919 [Helotiales sp. DMI_Dod_QoI]